MQAALEDARKQLLDFSLRNNFLNYRTLKARGVEFTGDAATRVAELLANSSRPLRTMTLPDAESARDRYIAKRSAGLAANNLDSSGELVASGAVSVRLGLNDHTLVAAADADELERRLANTAKLARSMLEEQGVNTLFLVLGALHWKESDSSDRILRAPLYLVPVTLERANVPHGYQLRFEGEDIQGNHTLQERLQNESISIGLPDDDGDLASYLDSVSSVISRKRDWRVDTGHVSLGFFSFTRYLMYLDLDASNWPESAAMSEHPVVHPLLSTGFSAEPDVFDDDLRLDEQPAFDQVSHVLEADSSQTEVVVQALNSQALVVQGPPGTGKSQTIANLLAEAVAQDKRVLFVAEKMAALEVVKRRLDQVGLGDAALELHSNKASRLNVIQELKRTLANGEPIHDKSRRRAERLRILREQLNGYSDALHEPVGKTGKTPFQLMGELEANRDKKPLGPRATGLEISSTTDPGIISKLQEVSRRITRWHADHGEPRQHPFRQVGLTAITPATQRTWLQTVSRATNSVDSLAGQQQSPLVTATQLPAGTVDELTAVADFCSEMQPFLQAAQGLNLASEAWLHSRQLMLEAADSAALALRERQHSKADLPQHVWDHAETELAHLEQLQDKLTHRRDIFYRWFSSDYRTAARDSRHLLGAEHKMTHNQMERSIGALIRYGRNARSFTARAEHWGAVAPAHTDVQGAARIAEAVKALCDLHERHNDSLLPGRLAALRTLDTGVVVDSVSSLRSSLAEAVSALDELTAASNLQEQPTDLQEWQVLLGNWQLGSERLTEAASWNRIRQEAAEAGMMALTDSIMEGELDAADLAGRVNHGLSTVWLDEAFAERPALAQFELHEHDAAIREFRSLDELGLAANRAELAHRHHRSLPVPLTGLGKAGILLAEFNKRRRHLPIRRLMEHTGSLIQKIKPIFMMSPLSVAVYLPRGHVEFDLVIFDEASQVRPSDALGALLRGKAGIVVGDDKQLPPTSFFDTMLEDDLHPDDAETTRLGDLESILGVFGARGAKQLMLKWHYRSRHESLIAVSNQEFYDNRLLLFPSPDQERKDAGVVLRHLPDNAYDRGRSRTNRGEAQAVAEAVLQHIQTQPHLSLGVATFSSAQADAIEAELERLMRDNELLLTFDNRHPFENLFIKNLETVQGDERDVIFISTGYGKDQDGRLFYNFGPLNRDGGQRRLNVLITRARIRTELFTNFTDEDMDPSRSSATGVQALRTYLRYARTGVLEGADLADRDDESPFEDQVYRALKDRGYTVHRQVGQAGYFIDIAVADPERPGRMILGIECDGARYHRSRSARERDRLRQTVLEGLGWRIHRIWSTDWFRDPVASLARTETAIQDALAAASAAPEPELHEAVATSDLPAEPTVQRAETAPAAGKSGELTLPAYELARLGSQQPGGDFHTLPAATISKWLKRVVEVESPVEVEVAGRRVANACGINRMGSRVRATIHSGVMHGVSTKLFGLHGKNTLISPGFDATALVPRSRAELPGEERQFSNVPAVEIEAAVLRLCRISHGLQESEAASETARLLGFGRASAAIQRTIHELIEGLVAGGRLQREGVGTAVFLRVKQVA